MALAERDVNVAGCRDCNISFASFEQFSAHAVEHFPSKFYICSQEDEKDSACFENESVDFTDVHSCEMNGDRQTSSATICHCRECGDEFVDDGELQKHLIAHEAALTMTDEQTCFICGEVFPTTFQLNSHSGTHMSARYHCSTCGHCFLLKRDLLVHKASNDCCPTDGAVPVGDSPTASPSNARSIRITAGRSTNNSPVADLPSSPHPTSREDGGTDGGCLSSNEYLDELLEDVLAQTRRKRGAETLAIKAVAGGNAMKKPHCVPTAVRAATPVEPATSHSPRVNEEKPCGDSSSPSSSSAFIAPPSPPSAASNSTGADGELAPREPLSLAVPFSTAAAAMLLQLQAGLLPVIFAAAPATSTAFVRQKAAAEQRSEERTSGVDAAHTEECRDAAAPLRNDYIEDLIDQNVRKYARGTRQLVMHAQMNG